MLEVVQTPLARRLWRISKFFQIPLNDPRLQQMTTYELEFYEYSMIADDPKKLESLQNHFYDPDFDEWLDEFDAEMEAESEKEKSDDYSEYEIENEKFEQIREEDLPDKETIEYVSKNREMNDLTNVEYDEEFEEDTDEEFEEFEDINEDFESVDIDSIDAEWEDVN